MLLRWFDLLGQRCAGRAVSPRNPAASEQPAAVVPGFGNRFIPEGRLPSRQIQRRLSGAIADLLVRAEL
jgi:hypothetical protein